MMSCTFRSLSKTLVDLFISAPRGTNIAIISPWVQELELKIPILMSDGQLYGQKTMQLSHFLNYLAVKRNLQIYLIVRENDPKIQYVTRIVRQNIPDSLHLFEVKHLHAKAFITNSMVLITSANLIPTSLYRNVESCSLIFNPYKNIVKYIEYEYQISLR